MPIHLVSGLPGNGKTLYAVHLLREAIKKKDRPVVVFGIDGLLQSDEYEQRDDATKWQECPDGALIFVDEAWKWFGHLHDARGQRTPDHVLALAEHRHRGIDFVWTTQAPNQIYPFARALIGQHTHLVRRFGTKFTDRYEWGELQEEVKSPAVRERALKQAWVLPSDLFGMYKSAESHTIKPRIPWRIFAIPVVLAIAAALAIQAWKILSPKSAAELTASAGAGAAPAAPPPTATATRQGPPPLDRSDPLALLRPRIPGQPWSAPAYDSVPFVRPPRIACMSSSKSCTCITVEQGTLYAVSDSRCRAIARIGNFDPTYSANADGPSDGPQAPSG